MAYKADKFGPVTGSPTSRAELPVLMVTPAVGQLSGVSEKAADPLTRERSRDQ
jgi:hypothetical protein